MVTDQLNSSSTSSLCFRKQVISKFYNLQPAQTISPPRLLGSSELLSSSSTVCADFLRLLDVACRALAEGAAATAAAAPETKACGVEGGSSDEKPTAVGGGEEEEPGSEAVPSRL